MSKKIVKKISLEFAIHTASGFHKTGLFLAKQTNEDKTVFGFQGQAPAVVNFSFAIELYLKAAIVKFKKTN